MPIRVLIADDEALTRETLRDYLEFDDELEIVGEASDGAVAVRQARALAPDVILMDMQMPVMDGVAATAEIMQVLPATRILGLSTFTSDRYVVDLLRAGAAGYLVKDTDPHALVDAVRRVATGESILSPEVTRHVVRGLEESVPAAVVPDPELAGALSEKELEVIRLLGRGMSNREMAAELFVTESTIKARFAKVTEKLGVRDRVQILLIAIERGLVEVGRRS